MVGVSNGYLYNLIKKGKLKTYKYKRYRLIALADAQRIQKERDAIVPLKPDEYVRTK